MNTKHAFSTMVMFSALLLILLLAGGCATYRAYPGKALPRDQVARLHILPAQIAINDETIDGRRYNTVELLPGRHTLEWEHAYPNGWLEPQRLVFHAEPGHHYRVGARFIPAPHPHGFLIEAGEFIVGTAIDAATLPLQVLFPQEQPDPDGPPDGELFVWITRQPENLVVAGYAPQTPRPHPPIMAIELDDELLR